MTNNSFAHRAILDWFVVAYVVYRHSLAFKLCMGAFSNLELVFQFAQPHVRSWVRFLRCFAQRARQSNA